MRYEAGSAERECDLFRTLQTMATNRNPAQMTTLYTEFVRESAQKLAEHLQEIGRLSALHGGWW